MPNRRIVKRDPLNAETSPLAWSEPLTRTAHHYVRSNFPVPDIAPAEYVLSVDGAVNTALSLTLDALRVMPQHELVVTMECAGNDRLGLRPLPAGEPWQSGAVSTARWRGVRLRDVLAQAALSDDAVEIVAEGADRGPRDDADTPDDVVFARGLPRDVAMHEDTLLAFDMNGEPLPQLHGAPVRLVVPGWYGMANVKWVTRLHASTREFSGYFQRARYVYDEAAGVSPVTRARVKSMITTPIEGDVLTTGPLMVRGWAWSGDGAITSVQLATDGADAWQDAELEPAEGPYAWTPWFCTVAKVSPGRLVLRSRATDATGAAQPDTPAWNRLGYGNNAVRAVVVDVEPR